MILSRRAIIAGLFLLAPPMVLATRPTPAEAQVTRQPGASIRLIDAGIVDGRPELGIEIVLEPGWKTYWRSPGDAGIPPFVDWSRSTGVARFDLRFPPPVRFGEEGTRSVGYTGSIVLPVDVAATDPAKPMVLDVDVQIGICRDICVPVAARLEATVGANRSPDAAVARLAAARAALPTPVVGATNLPRIVSFERDGGTPETILVGVEDDALVGDEERDLLVEGPDIDWALPQPRPKKIAHAPGAEGRRTTLWAFELAGLPDGADRTAAELRFTLLSGRRAFEQTIRLDGTGVLP